jgi:hypothetical protein
VRWLARWLEETDATLDAAVIVVAALSALGGSSHQAALDLLKPLAKTA